MLQGIVQVGIIFNQIGPITLSFAGLNMLEAAVRCEQELRCELFSIS